MLLTMITPDAGPPPALAKAADQVTHGLAQMYKICHQMEPDGPACQAIHQLQKAVADIEKHIGVNAGPPAGGIAPPTNRPFDVAATGVQNAMQGPPPGPPGP